MCVGLNRGFCATVLVALLGWGELHAEETLSIGVEQFSDKLDLLDDLHPAAVLLRAGLGEGLVSLRRRSDGAPTKGQFELAIADSVNINADFSRWSFRIRRGARFQSGRAISSEDVVFSLERCRAAGALGGVKKSVSRRSKTPYDAMDEWVDLEVDPELRGTLARDLARCPIWERESASIFGVEFGQGANVVGGGPFRISSYRPGKQYGLSRLGRSEQAGDGGPAAIVVRGFSEPGRGLTALREGTIALLFTTDAAVLGKASKDETLVLQDCGGLRAIKRRELLLSCEPSLDLARMRMGR